MSLGDFWRGLQAGDLPVEVALLLETDGLPGRRPVGLKHAAREQHRRTLNHAGRRIPAVRVAAHMNCHSSVAHADFR